MQYRLTVNFRSGATVNHETESAEEFEVLLSEYVKDNEATNSVLSFRAMPYN